MLNFQRLFESIPGLFIIYDLDFVIVAGSDAYFQTTLTKREEVVGRHLFEVFPDNPDAPNADGARNLRASLESVLKYRKPHTMAVQKYDIRRPDSVGGGFEERYWTLVNTPLFDENGVMTHIIHQAEDVTEFVQVQQQRNEQRQLNQALQSRSDRMEMEIYARVQELKEVNEQLQVANEALSEPDRAKTIFFSNVSHEFRTPLTLMLDPLRETLNRLNGQLPAVDREQLQMVQRNGERLLKLVNTLLDFPTSDSRLPTLPAARILLVDNNSDMRYYLRRLLSDRGYAVETAIDGKAALAAVEQQQPDLVLSDVMMPQLDGFGLLRELRANPTTRKIPIILLSARTGEEARIEGLEAGADDYLTKPFSARELLVRVEATLKLARLRREAEASLRESEKKYRTLFESIDEAFCLVEVLFDDAGQAVDNRFLETNPAFEKITGLENAIGKTIQELVPDIESHWSETLGKVAKTRQPERWSNRSQAMGFWFDLYAFAVDEPETHRVAIIFSNITERKQAERRVEFLTELSRKLGTVTDAAEINRIVTREVGTFLNGHRCYYLDVTPDGSHVTVLPDWRLDGPDLAGTYNLALFGAKEWWEMAARQPFGIDDVNAHPWTEDFTDNYTPINMQSYAIAPFVREGRWVASIGVSCDKPRHWTPDELLLLENVAARVAPLIDRARAEAVVAADLRDMQLLRELGARLVTEDDIQTLYQEILSAAIALTRSDAGTVQLLDEAAQDLVLIATQGFERNMTEHFYRVSASYSTSCGIALKNGNRTFVDFDVPESEDPDGSLRMHKDAGYFSGQSTPLLTRAGKPIGMVSTHWRKHHRPSERELRFLDLLARQAADLIEQRQTAAEREQLLAREQAARAEADRANRIKDEFLAVLSHELRSPLNPILGWSRLLQNGKLDETKTAQALATIERNAKLQSELIEDLLDVSRILQGKLSLTVAPVNLAFIIRAAMETVQMAAQAKSIKLEASLAEDVGLVWGDSTRLQQVIWNLLSNAVKFTPKEGQVNIRLERLDSYAFITVSDTGQGIAPDFLPYAFDYFRQANAMTTRKFGGLGLGLAIVRQLVELHGGTVRVESLGEGQGATFVVQIPLMPIPLKANRNELKPEPSLDLNGIKILIVDDDTDGRELVAFLLEQLGAQVISATSAHEALLILPQAKPDVLLSDIGMPDMDGYMLIQQVRTFSPEQGGQIPAIALTAYAGDMNQQQALAAGFQKHISKPIEAEKLIQVISSLIKA